VQVFEGTPRIAQRYAIDWVRLGDNGQTYRGDREGKNRSYYSYGAEVLAVANGVVVEVKDGIRKILRLRIPRMVLRCGIARR